MEKKPSVILTRRFAVALFFAVVVAGNVGVAIVGTSPVTNRVVVIGLCLVAAVTAAIGEGARGWGGAALALLTFRTVYVIVVNRQLGVADLMLGGYLAVWLALSSEAQQKGREQSYAWAVHGASLFFAVLYVRAVSLLPGWLAR